MMPPDTIAFQADRGDARLRLDQVLVRRVTGISRLSRSQVQQWIEAGAVTVDGRSVRRPSARVREGAELTVRVPASAPRRTRPQPEQQCLDVIHQDDDIIVINKPSGVVVHPSYKQSGGTLLNAVLWQLRDRADVRPGILTRLDKDTSGLVVIALRAAAHATLQRDAAARRMTKEYLAIVRGVPQPPSGRIVLPLAHDPNDRRRMAVTPGGAYCETGYEILASRTDPAPAPAAVDPAVASGWPASVARRTGAAEQEGPNRCPRTLSLVRCTLVTGRTHQIRVHLAGSGWPVLGDRVYGEPHPLLRRQALHAWRVSLLHPTTREMMQLIAPVPEEMGAMMRS